MHLKLQGKVALVTGSTAGIGKAIAAALAVEGAHVIVNGRTPARVNAAIADLNALIADTPESRDAGGRIAGFAADLTTDDGLSKLLAEVEEVDILVNNLGIYAAQDWTKVSADDLRRMFDVNVVSGAQLTSHFLPKMLAKGWGRVIFVASEAGVNIPRDMLAYGVSKAAQVALARGYAEATAGSEVTVNTVLPGPTHSEGITQFLDNVPLAAGESRATMEANFLQSLRPTSLLRRFAKAEEVADLVAYLASPRSAATNGAALRVEGGLLRHAL